MCDVNYNKNQLLAEAVMRNLMKKAVENKDHNVNIYSVLRGKYKIWRKIIILLNSSVDFF